MRGYHGGLGPGMIAGFLAGKMGKYPKRYLPGPYWDMYKAKDDANMTPYLKHVRLLPADAKEIL